MSHAQSDIFADIIKQAYIDNGVVRLVLATSVTDDQGAIHSETRQTIIMPLDGFVRSYMMLGEFLKKLGADQSAV